MNSSSAASDLFIGGAGDALFVFIGAAGGMNQVRVRIDETRKNNAPAQVQLLRAPGFRQAFDAASWPHGNHAIIAHQQRAIADDPKFAERASAPGNGPAQG
jgi:hypothetical protein